MADLTQAFMLASWFIGLMFGFSYGLRNDWGSLIVSLYLVIVFIIALIAVEIRSKK